MSTYNEIKKSIDQVRKDIVGIKRNLSRNEEDQREIRRAVDKAESTFQLNLRQEKDTAQQEFVQQSVAEISNEIQSVQQQIAQTQQEYDSEIEHIKNLDIASQYSDEQAITAESKVFAQPGHTAVTRIFFSSYPKLIAKLSVKLISAALLAAYDILENEPLCPSVLTMLIITEQGARFFFKPVESNRGAVTLTLPSHFPESGWMRR